jgi:hypothetical protein
MFNVVLRNGLGILPVGDPPSVTRSAYDPRATKRPRSAAVILFFPSSLLLHASLETY